MAAEAVAHGRHFNEGFRQFIDKARGQGVLPHVVDAAVLREGNVGPALGAGDADIGEAAFFLQAGLALFIQRPLVRKQAFLPAGQEHGAELKPLGGMEGHDADLVIGVAAVAVHHQGDMFEKARHVFKFAHGADELLQVFQPAFGFGALVVLPHFGVARFIQNHFGDIRVRKTLQRAWRQRPKLSMSRRSAVRVLLGSSSVSVSSSAAR